MDLTIIIATFGDPIWSRRAADTCAEIQDTAGVPIVLSHGDTLAQARNYGAEIADTEWLCFLDADDTLAPGYVPAIAAATGDLRAPALHLVGRDGNIDIPDLTTRDIATVNPCCIGTVLRRSMFCTASGFWEERAWEDWSLFRRCWLLGATITHVPDAVYIAHADPNGRNSTVRDGRRLHADIIASHDTWLAERAA